MLCRWGGVELMRWWYRPNAGFLYQLEIFHQAAFKISRSSKPARMYYMARTVEDVMSV